MHGARAIEAEMKKLEREYSRLHEYFATFAEMKETIAEHIARSGVDPKSKEVVAKLKTLFPNDFSSLNESVNGDMKNITRSFKQLETQLKQLDEQMNQFNDKQNR